ncbi:MAG: peptide chain release factor N(5)-glutamine methyltransferase [Bacteroidia bacterium]
MKIASNKINDVVRFFRQELSSLYEKEELESIMVYCFEAYLNIGRSGIGIKGNETMSESELLKFNFAIKDLKKHKPIQYILGQADFYKLKFKVNEHVLIPRPETEELVDLIIKDYQSSGRNNNDLSILDIGTGSGCIPIALKKNIPEAKISALDISEEALALAKENAEINGTEINFLKFDILSTLNLPAGQSGLELLTSNSEHPISDIQSPTPVFDIIVSNPPYIRISEKENMSQNVLNYEPHLALFVNDPNPLLFYKTIAGFALKYLKPNGKIYFEINQALGLESKYMLENKGFKNVELIKDLSNNYRILRSTI